MSGWRQNAQTTIHLVVSDVGRRISDILEESSWSAGDSVCPPTEQQSQEVKLAFGEAQTELHDLSMPGDSPCMSEYVCKLPTRWAVW